jgi:hypothetical protein
VGRRDGRSGGGAAAVASFLAAVLTGVYRCSVCSCQEVLRRNGRGWSRVEQDVRGAQRAMLDAERALAACMADAQAHAREVEVGRLPAPAHDHTLAHMPPWGRWTGRL